MPHNPWSKVELGIPYGMVTLMPFLHILTWSVGVPIMCSISDDSGMTFIIVFISVQYQGVQKLMVNNRTSAALRASPGPYHHSTMGRTQESSCAAVWT